MRKSEGRGGGTKRGQRRGRCSGLRRILQGKRRRSIVSLGCQADPHQGWTGTWSRRRRHSASLLSVRRPRNPEEAAAQEGPGTPVGELQPPTSGQREPHAWPASGPTGKTRAAGSIGRRDEGGACGRLADGETIASLPRLRTAGMSSWCLRRGRAPEEKWWLGRRTPLSLVSGPPWLTPEPLVGLEVIRRWHPRHPSNHQVLDPSAAAALHRRRFLRHLILVGSQHILQDQQQVAGPLHYSEKLFLSFIYLSNLCARVFASVPLLLKFQRISVLPKRY
ncbi:uncharacterized protein [Triticum aestivum]|uniref:uncharacterized protein n=1 Tax=Triticum aestivum TaxID=4565 RepID=UPI001D0297C5|nr:uncharacterized protein LOC123068622 [Triticum aestivum]